MATSVPAHFRAVSAGNPGVFRGLPVPVPGETRTRARGYGFLAGRIKGFDGKLRAKSDGEINYI
jgi:hypothetical protein